MRDLYMVSTATGGAAIEPAITSEQELQLRLRLLQSLQTSLEPQQLANIFFQQLQIRIGVSSLKIAADKLALTLGNEQRHQCDYSLKVEGEALGTFIFSRNKRFSESELLVIEQWLGMLVHPWRNALQHQATLRLCMQDSLTEVGNRAAMEESLKRELSLSERYQQDVSLLLVDVDHFKQVNDVYGHSVGDQVLIQIATRLRTLSRSSDQLFRYGGEEFVVLLANTDRQGAQTIAERLREGISATPLMVGERVINVSVSIGVATHKAKPISPVKSLFDCADNALYQAKHQGRNRVVLGDE